MTNHPLLSLVICLCLFTISANLLAQNYVGVAPWDNALSYNPSMVGAYTDQSIQMNMQTRKRTRIGSPVAISLFPIPNPAEFIGFEDNLPSPIHINRSYFLGYQKTIPIKERYRFTGGLQMQKYNQRENVSQDILNLGFTFNFHYSIAKRKSVLSHWSIGYQFNFISRTPNSYGTRNAYDEFIAPTLSYFEFREQFRNQGSNHSFSVNYSYIRKGETGISVGAVFNSYQYKVASSIDPSRTGEIKFLFSTLSLPLVNLEIQQAFKNKILLDLRVIGSSDSQIAAGLGVRMFRHNLLKLLLVTSPIPINAPDNTRGHTSLNLSLDMKRYKYILSAEVFDLSFIKAGVVYRFDDRDTSSLISIGQ